MSEENSVDRTEVHAEIKITPDFVLDIYKAAKAAKGKQRKMLFKIAEVLSDHLGEDIISD